MVIKVCVGSSCHLKGSYDVIMALQEVIKRYDVEDQVELQASFCLGCCAQGVTVKAEQLTQPMVQQIGQDEFFMHNVNKDNVETLFAQEVYPLLSHNK